MNPTVALQRYFGYQTFRSGQREIIDDVLTGENVLAVLPTGSGKSICYQIPAVILPGTILVVSPLLSLMEDQVKQLKQKGFNSAIAINSFLSANERQVAFKKLNQYKLIYLSPEMLQNKMLMKSLDKINVSLFVIDEAHCISQWGPEFRPDYLKLHQVLKRLQNPKVMALSATATPEVQADILKQFSEYSFKKHIYPMDRENIALSVERMSSNSEKDEYLIDLLERYPVPSMIYFSSKKEAERVARKLSVNLSNLAIAYYHGGMEPIDRNLIQQQFMNGELDIVCCTSAFGMGINKPDVRLVVHYHVPSQIESFIQEIGRAGRDHLPSVSIVLYSNFDYKIPQHLIQQELPETSHVANLLVKINQLNQLPANIETEVSADYFGLTEVQWRFLYFQLEKHGMIKENQFVPLTQSQLEETTKSIKQLITRRNRYKSKKLIEMFNWLETEGCRKKALYSSFQPTLKPTTWQCCDRCGFDLSKWNPEVYPKKQLSDDWEHLLHQLFF